MNGSGGNDAKALMLFEAQKKSVGAAYLLWIFLGGAGGHRFYLGRGGSGFLMLLGLVFGLAGATPLLVIIGLVALIDAFLIPGWARAHNTLLAGNLAQTISRPLPNPPPLPTARGPHQKQPATQQRSREQSAKRTYAGAIAATIILVGFIGAISSRVPRTPEPGSGSTTAAATIPTAVVSNFSSPSGYVENTQDSRAPDQPPAPPTAGWSATTIETPSDNPIAPTAPVETITVPTDLRASYSVEKLAKAKSGIVRIVSRRDGPSGISYQHRECDCANATYRTLGDGSTLAEMKASPSETKMTSLVMGRDGSGSISFHVCEHACAAIGSKLNRRRTTNPLGL